MRKKIIRLFFTAIVLAVAVIVGCYKSLRNGYADDCGCRGINFERDIDSDEEKPLYDFNIHTNPLAFRLDDYESDFGDEEELFECLISKAEIPEGDVRSQCDYLENWLDSRFYINNDIYSKYGELYSYKLMDYCIVRLSLNRAKCLNYFLVRKLHDTPVSAALVDGVDVEIELMKELLMAQYQLFECHDADCGSDHYMTYIGLEDDLIYAQNEMICFILGVHCTPRYHHPELTNSLIQYQYSVLLKNGFPCYEYCQSFNPRTDSINILNMKWVWDRLISHHKHVSQNLSVEMQQRFDDALYVLLRYHLKQLKEEFQSYGVISEDIGQTVLPLDYSDDELIHYPGFTKKWKEYQKQFD